MMKGPSRVYVAQYSSAAPPPFSRMDPARLMNKFFFDERSVRCRLQVLGGDWVWLVSNNFSSFRTCGKPCPQVRFLFSFLPQPLFLRRHILFLFRWSKNLSWTSAPFPPPLCPGNAGTCFKSTGIAVLRSFCKHPFYLQLAPLPAPKMVLFPFGRGAEAFPPGHFFLFQHWIPRYAFKRSLFSSFLRPRPFLSVRPGAGFEIPA